MQTVACERVSINARSANSRRGVLRTYAVEEKKKKLTTGSRRACVGLAYVLPPPSWLWRHPCRRRRRLKTDDNTAVTIIRYQSRRAPPSLFINTIAPP